MQEYDEFEEDYDLLEIITGNANSIHQFLIFHGSNHEIYAINVSKIVEVLVYKNLDMVFNGEDETLIRGSAKVRDMMATVINFDEWFGNDVLDDSAYEYMILTGYGGYNLGIMVKDVDYIMNINLEDMQNNSMNNSKTNFVASVALKGGTQLCTIFDCDKLLTDVFDELPQKNSIEVIEEEQILSQKYVLFADDSKFVRKLVTELFVRLGLQSMVFENGLQLYERLVTLDSNEVGLIITDLEMPMMDGQSLVEKISSTNDYGNINIIVHSNMSNFVLEKSLLKSGAKEVIGKIDMKQLSKSVCKHFQP